MQENIHGHRGKFFLFFERIERLRGELRKKREDIHILDVGCGNGVQMTSPLGAKGYSVIGVDVHPPSIEWAIKNNTFSRVQFVLTDVDSIKKELFDNQLFDVIILSDILEHVQDPENLLNTMRGFLERKGILLISIPNGYGPFEIENYLAIKFPLNCILRGMVKIKRFFMRKIERDTISTIPYHSESGHIQFFSWRRMHHLFQSAGFSVSFFRKGCFLGGALTAPIIGRIPLLMRLNIAVGKRLPFFLSSVWYFECIRKNE